MSGLLSPWGTEKATQPSRESPERSMPFSLEFGGAKAAILIFN
jgi:hypothetical protein